MIFHDEGQSKQNLEKPDDWKTKLRITCADLISMGHYDVEQYGYTFFKIACKSAKGLLKKQIESSMVSIQLALSKPEEVQKFFKNFDSEK